MEHPFESGDEMEYSIQLSGNFHLKKFGVNLIYENDKKDYQSDFEAMIANAPLPNRRRMIFFDEDVSTDQAMAGDKKIHPSGFGDKRKGIMTFSDASKGRCLSAQEAAQSRWDEELVARLQDKEDATTSKYCELNITLLDGLRMRCTALWMTLSILR
ncbi:disease resistance protein RUN1-like [Fagus crenata]